MKDETDKSDYWENRTTVMIPAKLREDLEEQKQYDRQPIHDVIRSLVEYKRGNK